MSDYKFTLQQSILEFVNSKGFTLITPIQDITKFEQKFEYKCECETIRERTWANIKTSKDYTSDFVPKCCQSKIKVWYANDDLKEHYDEKKNEQWYKYKELWFSNKGNVINRNSNKPSSIKDDIIYFNKSNYNHPEILAKLFRIDNHELLNSKNYTAKFIEDNNKSVSNIIIVEEKNEVKISEDFKEESIKVPELENYVLFNTGKILREKTLKKKEQLANLMEKNNRMLLRTAEDKKYRVDQLMIYAFKPIEGKNCYKDYDDVLVIHKDGDYKNNHITNLEVHHKKLTIADTHKLNVENRIKTLHQDINDYMKKLEGNLIIDVNEITNIFEKFQYVCKCGVTYERTLKNLKERNDLQECRTCKKLNKTTSSEDTLIIDDEKFIKNDVCYVSDKGRILSLDKKNFHTIRQKDNSVRINNINYNAKVLIAKTFKIEYYEFLDDKNYFVSTKDNSDNFEPDNLYVWSGTKQLLNNLPNSKQYYEKNKTKRVKLYDYRKPTDNENIEHKLFYNTEFFRDGTINVGRNLFYKGNQRKDGYYQITLDGKTFKVHRVICFLFNPIEGKTHYEDYNELDVNHINGIKDDNRAENLEWLSRVEHRKFGIQNENHEQFKPILLYKKNTDGSKGEFLKRVPTIVEAHNETKHSKNFIKKLANLTSEEQNQNKKAKFWFEWDI